MVRLKRMKVVPKTIADLDSDVFGLVLKCLAPSDLAAAGDVSTAFRKEVRATPIMRWASFVKKDLPELRKMFKDAPCPQGETFISVPQFSYLRATLFAAATGNLDVLKTLHAAGFPWTAGVMAYAARMARKDILRWALQTKGSSLLSEWTCSMAVAGSDRDCLTMLKLKKCPWGPRACEESARTGNLAALKYLHENGCGWDEETCGAAASTGNVECLKYAREKNCNWDSMAVYKAASNGHLATVEWLVAQNCAMTRGACMVAATYGHLRCLMFLRGKGCDWDPDMCAERADDHSHRHVVRWVLAQDKTQPGGASVTVNCRVRFCGLASTRVLNGMVAVVTHVDPDLPKRFTARLETPLSGFGLMEFRVRFRNCVVL